MNVVSKVAATGAFALSLLLVVHPARPVAAQDATPATTAVALGVDQCTVDPINSKTYGAAAAAATPVAGPPSIDTGRPADSQTVLAVTDTIQQSIACTNAGDLGRLLAVIDPSYASTLIGVPPDQLQAAIDAASALSAPPDEPATPLVDDRDQSAIMTRLLSIDRIVSFSDDTAAAVVQIDSPQTGPTTATIYLRDNGNRFVITIYIFAESGAIATPAG